MLISDFLFGLLYLKAKFIQYVHYHASHVNIVIDAFNITKATGATYLIGRMVGYQSTTTWKVYTDWLVVANKAKTSFIVSCCLARLAA